MSEFREQQDHENVTKKHEQNYLSLARNNENDNQNLTVEQEQESDQTFTTSGHNLQNSHNETNEPNLNQDLINESTASLEKRPRYNNMETTSLADAKRNHEMWKRINRKNSGKSSKSNKSNHRYASGESSDQNYHVQNGYRDLENTQKYEHSTSPTDTYSKSSFVNTNINVNRNKINPKTTPISYDDDTDEELQTDGDLFTSKDFLEDPGEIGAAENLPVDNTNIMPAASSSGISSQTTTNNTNNYQNYDQNTCLDDNLPASPKINTRKEYHLEGQYHDMIEIDRNNREHRNEVIKLPELESNFDNFDHHREHQNTIFINDKTIQTTDSPLVNRRVKTKNLGQNNNKSLINDSIHDAHRFSCFIENSRYVFNDQKNNRHSTQVDYLGVDDGLPPIGVGCLVCSRTGNESSEPEMCHRNRK